MKYSHVVTEVFRKPWAILPEKFSVISELVMLRASGGRLTEQDIRDRLLAADMAAGPRGGQQEFGTAAVIPVYGVIGRRASLMSSFSGGTSVENLTKKFRAALADPSVKAIVLDVDSPGGTVDGIDELATEIYNSRKKKKTIAVANGMAASAAYWIASACNEVVVTPTGSIGSIGVFAAHEDLSKLYETMGVKVSLISAGKFKTEGNEYEPLTDEARAELQSKVDAFYGMFVKAVARGRGASQADVREGFGQGRMVLAWDGIKARMSDRVSTLDQTLERLGAAPGSSSGMSGAEHRDSPRADDGGDGPLEEKDCMCACDACQADDCMNCTNENCVDPNCEHGPRAMSALDRRRRELDLH
jgi:signal peptide peptidase SppA